MAVKELKLGYLKVWVRTRYLFLRGQIHQHVHMFTGKDSVKREKLIKQIKKGMK